MLKVERIRWLFTLEEDYTYKSSLKFNDDYCFYSNSGNLLFSVDKEGTLTIYKGYSWDGCTPKFKLWKFSIGTYDGYLVEGKPATYYASLVHDALYQFLYDLKLDRKSADDIFLDLMPHYRYKYLYYYVVRLFGWIFV
jgi:hypothetical protein